MIDLVALQKFLNEPIVEVKPWQRTLFDIAGFPHYENVVSNVYAYFLDPKEEHGLGTLFLEALQCCIETHYDFDVVHVYREFPVAEQKRIDLVITNGEVLSESYSKVIIIENKLFHHLHNDLALYYKHFSLEDANKQGVLLTLSPLAPNNGHYINITHRQWLDQVWSMIGNYIVDMPEDGLYHLKQFSKNLSNYTMSQNAKEYFAFYIKNREEIGKIDQLQQTLYRHIWDQVNTAHQLLPHLNLKVDQRKSRTYTYYYNPCCDTVYFTVIPQIMDCESPSVHIIVELWNSALEKLEELEQLQLTPEDKKILLPKNPSQIKAGYLHFASEEFKVTEDVIDTLGVFIAEKIKNSPLESIYTAVKKHLYPEFNPN